MRRLSLFAGLAVYWLAGISSVSAQSIPHLDLVAGLRQQGLPDLAMEYLDKLQAMKLPELDAVLPLEYARTRLDLAADEPEESRRIALLTQARSEFDKFLQANANHPEATSANLDLARLVSLQGKNQLSKSRRSESKEQANAEKAVARSYFQQAATRYEAAAKLLDAKIKALDDTKDKAQRQKLDQTRIRAVLDRGINVYDMAQTYNLEGKELTERGEAMKRAVKIFETLLTESDKTPAVWVSQAWLAQCLYEMDDRLKADSEFNAILKEKSPNAVGAVRLVRAFKIRHAFTGDDPKAGSRYTVARTMSEAWLKDYGGAKNTPEGLGVRYILAMSYKGEAEAGIKRDKVSGKPLAISGVAENQLKSAERIFKDLLESDNEFTERATRNRMICILTRTDAASKGEPQPKDMKTFEAAYLQAIVQQARLNERVAAIAAGKEKVSDPDKEIKAEEKKRYKACVEFLETAIGLVKPTDPPREVYEAKVLLAYCYQFVEQAQKAIELAEKLMRENVRSRFAPQMGALAVNEHVVMLNALRGGEGMEEEKDKKAKALTAKIKELAAYMEKTWSTEAGTDSARHTLGYLLRYEKNFQEAIKVYSRIQDNYSMRAQARLELGAALFALVRNSEETNPQKLSEYVAENIKKHQSLWNQVIAEMEEVPEPVSSASLAEAQAYCNEKVQLAQLYLLEGKNYDRPEAIGKALDELIPKLTELKDKNRDEALYSARSVRLFGIQGKGFAVLKDRKFTDAATLLDPVIAEIKADLDKEAPTDPPPSFDRYRRAQREIISLGLRASVQDNKIDRAKELLELLQKGGSTFESSSQIFRQLANTIKQQIDTLRKEKKVAEEKKLVDGFSQFLDSIAKQEKIPDSMLVFLSQGYSGVDQHKKAAELLERIIKNPPPMPKEGEDADALKRTRQSTQFLLAREYRLAKEFDKADKLIKEILGNAKMPGWGFRSVEVRKESFYLLEDQNKFKDAVNGWVAYANNFGAKLPPPPPKNDKEASQRKMYFDLFFEAQRCSAKAYHLYDAKKAPDPVAAQKTKDEGFGKVATRLAELETKNEDLSVELKEKIRDLLDEYPPLKEKYKAAGGKLLGGSTGGN